MEIVNKHPVRMEANKILAKQKKKELEKKNNAKLKKIKLNPKKSD